MRIRGKLFAKIRAVTAPQSEVHTGRVDLDFSYPKELVRIARMPERLPRVPVKIGQGIIPSVYSLQPTDFPSSLFSPC